MVVVQRLAGEEPEILGGLMRTKGAVTGQRSDHH